MSDHSQIQRMMKTYAEYRGYGDYQWNSALPAYEGGVWSFWAARPGEKPKRYTVTYKELQDVYVRRGMSENPTSEKIEWRPSGGGSGFLGTGPSGQHYLVRRAGDGYWNLHVSGHAYGPFYGPSKAKANAEHMERMMENPAALTWALLGLGAVGLGVGAYFVVKAVQKPAVAAQTMPGMLPAATTTPGTTPANAGGGFNLFDPSTWFGSSAAGQQASQQVQQAAQPYITQGNDALNNLTGGLTDPNTGDNVDTSGLEF